MQNVNSSLRQRFEAAVEVEGGRIELQVSVDNVSLFKLNALRQAEILLLTKGVDLCRPARYTVWQV